MRLCHQTRALHDFGLCSFILVIKLRSRGFHASGLISTCCSFCLQPSAFRASCGRHTTVMSVVAAQTPFLVPSPYHLILFSFLQSSITTWLDLSHVSVYKNESFTGAQTYSLTMDMTPISSTVLGTHKYDGSRGKQSLREKAMWQWKRSARDVLWRQRKKPWAGVQAAK